MAINPGLESELVKTKGQLNEVALQVTYIIVALLVRARKAGLSLSFPRGQPKGQLEKNTRRSSLQVGKAF
jgi:hypothetical protein